MAMRHAKYAHSYEVVAVLPEPLRALRKLAFNLRWTWRQETWDLFREMDRALWEEARHNPLELINRIGKEKLARLSEDALFVAKLRACEEELDRYLSAPNWFDERYPGRRDDTCIAYFCAEFGLTESLPIYSGGLGVLAGDHLKAASDLGLPLVAVGLLYSRGYFQQQLSPDGWQQEEYPNYDFYRMPLLLVRGSDDQPLRVEISFPDRNVTCQLWRAQVGRVPLFLLDSNVLENAPSDQGITDTLYGGDEDMRFRQEAILGIGGLRALEALGIQPTVCHMNEGHSAFLVLERLRQYMQRAKTDLRTARQVVVAGNVFTTHTPVPAGFDSFSPAMVQDKLGNAIQEMGASFGALLKMGRMDPANETEPFNMAVLAMENSNHVNGVSHLHAEVARRMFHARWPEYPEEEVPIAAITNGVHTLSWIGKRMASLLDRYLGAEWREMASDRDVWRAASEIPDAELWEVREDQRGDFVRYCRKRVMDQQTRRAGAMHKLAETAAILDPRILTIGFARRFATYKRATLLLSDRERLKSLLTHPERPMQFVFAGKSHPRDDGGKRLIQDLVRFIESEGLRTRMVFIEDYDIGVARALVQGVDVWLNTPRRPLEASGTSGMKVVPNGGLNCSILDGWWAEAYQPGLGWAIGDTREHADAGYQDWLDSRSLYQILEQEVAPLFYHRNESGLPISWLEMMRNSMRELAPRFSTARMVRDYTTRFYMPAADAYRNLDQDGQARAKAALKWREAVQQAWSNVQIVNVEDDAGSVNELGGCFNVRVQVALGKLEPSDVQVQVVTGQVGPNRSLIETDVVTLNLEESKDGLHIFSGEIKCDRPGHRGYVARIVPSHPDVNVPHELPIVRWQSGAL
jgi:starch phosphorylase